MLLCNCLRSGMVDILYIFISHIETIQDIKEKFLFLNNKRKTSNICVPCEKLYLSVNIFDPCWSENDFIISYKSVSFVCIVNYSKRCYKTQFISIIHRHGNQKSSWTYSIKAYHNKNYILSFTFLIMSFWCSGLRVGTNIAFVGSRLTTAEDFTEWRYAVYCFSNQLLCITFRNGTFFSTDVLLYGHFSMPNVADAAVTNFLLLRSCKRLKRKKQNRYIWSL